MNYTEELAAKQELWRQRVQNFQSSGLTQLQWCQQHDQKAYNLSYWVNKFKKASALPAAETPQFVEIPPCSQPAGRTAPVVIHIGDAAIDISEECSQQLLNSLIGALRHA